MEPELNLNLNDVRVVREKQDRDVLMGMIFGATAVFSLTLTSLVGTRFLGAERRGLAVVLILLTLVGSVISYFVAKKNERWYVVSTLLNHMGIGLALYILLEALQIEVRPLYLALSGIPACAGLCGACLMFRSLDGKARVTTVYVGAVALGVLAIVSVVLAAKGMGELWVASAVSAVTCCAVFCGVAWTASKPDRSVYQTMAIVSFTIYAILILVAAVVVFLGIMANSSDSRSSSDRKRSSSRSTSSSGIRSRRPRTRSWFYYPLFMNSGRSRRSSDYDDRDLDRAMEDPGVFYEDEARRQRERRNLRILLVILAVLVALVIFIAVASV